MPSQDINKNEKPTNPERLYALDLDDRFKLNLSLKFLNNRKDVRNLIHNFGFHKHLDEIQRRYTGYTVVETVKSGIENDIGIDTIARRLNDKFYKSDNENVIKYTEKDVGFIIALLMKSENPPKLQDISKTPTDLEKEEYELLEEELYEEPSGD